MVLFQNCVRQRRPVSKMAAMTKNRNFFKWLKLILEEDHPRIISAKFG
jgi:IS4 transposase